MEDSSIIIQDDGEKTTVIIDFGNKTVSNLPSKVPKNHKNPKEKKDICPRCENKTLIETEKGQICTVCGWPDREDARERIKKRKKALISKK